MCRGARLVSTGALILLLITLVPVQSLAAASSSPYYSVTDLGSFPGATAMRATDINEQGQIVGGAAMSDGTTKVFLYTGGELQEVGIENYDPVGVTRINDRGQILAGSVLLSGGQRIPLNNNSSVPFPMYARALDNAERVNIVGSSSTVINRSPPVRWQAGAYTTFLPAGSRGVATGINDRGQIVGTQYVSIDNFAFRYDSTTGQVAYLPGYSGEAYAINNVGHVIATQVPNVPVLWRDGQVIDLMGQGLPLALNDRDDIVGFTSETPTTLATRRATLWREGVRIDLNTLIPADSGWTLNEATAINESGQIVGTGTRTGQTRAFLLTPRFHDLSPAEPHFAALVALADRGIVRGYGEGQIGPTDLLLRAQVAGMITRTVNWDTENWPDTTFSDQGVTDADLWRQVQTLAHYGVAQGYADGTFDPTGTVLHQQVTLFVARALIAKGYWQEQVDTDPYPDLPNTTPREQRDRRVIATYVHYAGAIPDRPIGQPWGDWDQAATRGWSAEIIWHTLQTTPTP